MEIDEKELIICLESGEAWLSQVQREDQFPEEKKKVVIKCWTELQPYRRNARDSKRKLMKTERGRGTGTFAC